MHSLAAGVREIRKMRTIELQRWAELPGAIQALQPPSKKSPSDASRFLYRGHSDADWQLKTTLERIGADRVALSEHYGSIYRIKPQIETFTGTTWAVPSPPEYKQWLEDHDTRMPFRYPGYDYMVYLRHHGFPSPLLDWSRSMYVAAYFAFREHTASDHVAIFAYVERPTGIKGYSSDTPSIWGMGPYVRTHRRHFLQQSEYTICIVRNNEWRYAPHGEAFGRDSTEQDLIWKFKLPSAERVTVLKELDAYNLNSYSLFGSEESLMDTLAFREFCDSDADCVSGHQATAADSRPREQARASARR